MEKSFKSEPILTQSVPQNCETNKNVNISNAKPIIYQTFNFNQNASIPSTSSTEYSDITININTSPNVKSSQSSNSSDTKSDTLKISDLKQILKTDLSAYRIKSMKFMIKTIEKLKQNFIEKHLDFNNWVKVSNKMKKSGYKTFNSVKCKKDFYHFASIYRKVCLGIDFLGFHQLFLIIISLFRFWNTVQIVRPLVISFLYSRISIK